MFHDGRKMNGALRHHQSTNAEYLSKRKCHSLHIQSRQTNTFI